MITLPLAPLWILEYLVALIVLILNLLSLRLSRRLVDQDPENALWLFFNWLAIAFLILAVTHMISHTLLDLITYWNLPNLALIQRIFGGFDTFVYVVIAAITLFFHRIQRLYRRMEADHHHLEETSHEILALNREMEALVMERTMSEMALGMAHGIRNPLHVIGGFSHRLLRKTDEDDPSRAWATAIAEEARRIEQMVEFWANWVRQYPALISIEDGMSEQDWPGWKLLTETLGKKIQLVGDDIYVTNTSIFKRGMRGVYQHCSEKHLHRYLAEFDFRYNHREALGWNDEARTVAAVRGGEGKRLTYHQPR